MCVLSVDWDVHCRVSPQTMDNACVFCSWFGACTADAAPKPWTMRVCVCVFYLWFGTCTADAASKPWTMHVCFVHGFRDATLLHIPRHGQWSGIFKGMSRAPSAVHGAGIIINIHLNANIIFCIDWSLLIPCCSPIISVCRVR